MTEAEVIELVGIHGANAITSFTVYISFTFGFLATAHFVGASLTSAQTIVATVLYWVAAASATACHALFNQIVFATLESSPTLLDDLPLMQGAVWVWGMVFIELSGIAASTYFMWSVRHPAAK